MLDTDRGVTKRRHPNGFVVAMYKDEPGVFLNLKGEPVGAEVARKAGFDVETLEVERRKAEKMAHARAEIEKEFESKSEEIERILDAQSASYSVRHVGGGKYGIFDDAGERLTEQPMTKEEAQDFMSKLDLPTEKSNGPAETAHGQPEAP